MLLGMSMNLLLLLWTFGYLLHILEVYIQSRPGRVVAPAVYVTTLLWPLFLPWAAYLRHKGHDLIDRTDDGIELTADSDDESHG